MEVGRFAALINDLVNLPLKERDSGLMHEIGRIRVQYRDRPIETLRNMSVTAARYEIEPRAKLVYNAAVFVIERAGVTRDLSVAEEVRTAVATLIEAQAERLMQLLRDRFGDVVEIESESFTVAAEEQAREYAARTELFVAGRPRPPQPSVNREQPTIHFHGQVGSVQTGDNASAYVTQNGAPPEVTVALETIAAHFRDLRTEEAEEATAVVADLRKEIQSPTPNRLRLAGAATALGGVVQTVAALEPAFAAIKVFLRGIGIDLP